MAKFLNKQEFDKRAATPVAAKPVAVPVVAPTVPAATAAKPVIQPQVKTPIVQAEVSACPVCGSTVREKYHHVTEQDYAGLHPTTGLPYTHIVRKWTKCANCGQTRIDRSHENRTGT